MLEAFVRQGYRIRDAESVERDRHGVLHYFVNNMVGVVHNDYLIGAWGTQRDVTVNRELEYKLKSVATDASEANQAKSRFLANVSHEIRTPLSVILGFADLALDDENLPHETRGYVEAIRRNGRQLAQLLGEVLDLSKIEARRMEIESLRFPLSPFLTDVVSSMGVSAREKGLSLKLERVGALPKHVTTDPTKLRQILLNLLCNGIKFTEKGHVTLTVRLSSKPEPGKVAHLEFCVSDSGIGIPDGQKERLFQPFTQAEAGTSRKYGGTGLGLTLSRELSSALGGSLVLSRSEVGRGSTFICSVPCGELEAELADMSEARNDSSDELHLGGKKVLLVEDSEDNQILISHYLSAAGLSVEVARNGREGIEKARRQRFDLVVMDIQMPGMDGHEAARRLRAEGFKKPIIALTANAFKEDRDRAFESGFSEYLTKPVNRTLLLRTLDQRLADTVLIH